MGCKHCWHLAVSYPAPSCVLSRVLQELKRRNEMWMAGNNFVTSNIKESRDKSYYFDLSSLHCSQGETAGMTYLRNEEFTRKWGLGFTRQSILQIQTSAVKTQLWLVTRFEMLLHYWS